jgi:hypothetical protein
MRSDRFGCGAPGRGQWVAARCWPGSWLPFHWTLGLPGVCTAGRSHGHIWQARAQSRGQFS